MPSEFVALAVVMIGFGVMFQVIRNPGKALFWLFALLVFSQVVAPPLLSALWVSFRALPLWDQILVLAWMPFVLLALVAAILPRRVRSEVLGRLLYDVAKFLFLLPFRLLRLLFRLVFP
ncbi:MAG: hypothetical protein JNL98_04145 [Bryobacterales bacterium]|nr:hypothetical protein [Bryobacterales bacterium]